MENTTNTKPDWHKLIERVNNFYWDSNAIKKQIEGKDILFEELYNCCESIAINLFKPHENQNDLILNMVFKEIINFWFERIDLLSVFNQNVSLAEDVLDAYFFYALVMFIDNSKYIKSISFRKFTYDHSKFGYNKKESKNYFNFKHPGIDGFSNLDNLRYNDAALRRERNRIIKKRLILNKHIKHNKRPVWSGMSISSEHEWSFYFFLNNLSTDDPLSKTFKRMSNLYNEHLYKAASLSSEDEEDYNEKAHQYKKFLNRLKKIKYEDFLDLSKTILEHIKKDKLFYGINIYRFERMFRLHNITNTISLLLNSKDTKEERNILLKDIYLNNIDFPRLHKKFSTFEDFPLANHFANIFLIFKETIAISCCLILDALIEKKCFGDDWENLFYGVINKMSEKIYYDPEKINYTIEPKSQEYFEEIRSIFVRHILNIPLFIDEEDSDS